MRQQGLIGLVAATAVAAMACVTMGRQAEEVDTDGDGLSDFHEVHKHRTDPSRADSDGDGLIDSDKRERREFTYSVRAVMHIARPYDVAAMNDDYQDAWLLDEQDRYGEIEVVIYPFSTAHDEIVGSRGWRPAPDELAAYVEPGVTTNWDEPMRRELEAELREAGIVLDELTDAEAAPRVARWLLDRARYEDSFTVFAMEFDEDGRPRVAESIRPAVKEELERRGRTLEEQWERELFGRGMFRTRQHGSCTSAAIYLATGLKAAGIPTRTVVCTPLIDASDEREVRMAAALKNHRVRTAVEKTARRLGDSWASHTFNEVWVGGRWRRLNYARLGQPVLDDETLGLMVHVTTFADHAESGLVGWGRRKEIGRPDIFGGSNPYSCISLSDWFGPHADVENPEVDEGFKALTIIRAYWYGTENADLVRMDLDEAPGAGHLVVRVEEFAEGGGTGQYGDFYEQAAKDFVLRAPGRPDVRAVAMRGYRVDEDRGIRDFYLRIPAEELARMEPGVPYALEAVGEGPRRWRVAGGVTVTRPEDANEPPAGLEARTLTRAAWAQSADAPEWMRNLEWHDESGLLIAHVEEWAPGGFEALRRFTERADNRFVLRSEGRPDVIAECAPGGISTDDGRFREVVLVVRPEDFSRIERGVEYTLHPMNTHAGFEWRVAEGLVVVLR